MENPKSSFTDKIRTVIGFCGGLLFILETLIFCTIAIILGILRMRMLQGRCNRLWGRIGLWLFRVRVRVIGLENAPKEGAIYLFSHGSHLDILAVFAYLPVPISFGAKQELFKIPIFSQAMRYSGTFSIPRQDRKAAFQVYADAEKRFDRGDKIALAPEGTRQKEAHIGPFKSGPFIFAINSGAQAVPVVLKGLFEALPKTDLIPNKRQWYRQATLELLPPIDSTQYTIKEKEVFKTRVREMMLEAYENPSL